MRFTLLLVATGLLHASIAGADDLVASATKTDLVIERVGTREVEPVYQEPLFASRFGATEWAWSDPRTLWVLRREGNADATTKLAIAKIVDGKAKPERELTLADFKLAKDPDPDGRAIDWGNRPGVPHLVVTQSHGVWVQRIIKIFKTADGTRDYKLGYLRVDRAAPLATARPVERDIVFDGEPQHQPELPAVAAPQGYSATTAIAKVHDLAGRPYTFAGMQCIGPDSRFAFPDLVIGVAPDVTEQIPGRILVELAKEDVVKVEWVSASPPVLRYKIKVKATGNVRSAYLDGCQRERPAPQVFPDGRWLDGGLIRGADGSELGKLRGGDRAVIAR